MNQPTHEAGLSASARRRLRRKRSLQQRKSRIPEVPIAASDPAPPQPGRILGEDEEKALRRAEDGGVHRPHDWKDPKNPPLPEHRATAAAMISDPDADTAPPSHGKRRSVEVVLAVPVKSMPILEWYADLNRLSPEDAAMQLLGSMLAKLRPDWRKATTGTAGGSVRASDIGSVTE